MPAWWEGQDDDPESKISHMTKAIASLVVLHDAMMRGNWVDDRPPKTADGWVEELNAKARRCLKSIPSRSRPSLRSTSHGLRNQKKKIEKLKSQEPQSPHSGIPG